MENMKLFMQTRLERMAGSHGLMILIILQSVQMDKLGP